MPAGKRSLRSRKLHKANGRKGMYRVDDKGISIYITKTTGAFGKQGK